MKKILSLLISITALLPVAVYAEETDPSQTDEPENSEMTEEETIHYGHEFPEETEYMNQLYPAEELPDTELIEITADGHIGRDEVEDFILIQEELERISVTVETLQLWTEKMMAEGMIDKALYESVRAEKMKQ